MSPPRFSDQKSSTRYQYRYAVTTPATSLVQHVEQAFEAARLGMLHAKEADPRRMLEDARRQDG